MDIAELRDEHELNEISKQDIYRILECSVCLSAVVEPVTICCGHSFCRPCLVNSLRMDKKKCPSCRAVCHATPEQAPVNCMLQALSRALNPVQYDRRLREMEEDRASWTKVVPIFYYNDPLFPGGSLSLHLFEPRYKLMMQRIVNTSRMFAYVPNLSTYSASVGDIAMCATLTEVEILADGRCLLEARLEGRHRILEHYVEEGTHGLHYCRMEAIKDFPVENEEDRNLMHQLHVEGENLCCELLQGSIKQRIEGYHGLPPKCTEGFSLWLCGVCVVDSRTKMEMLRTQDTLKRLQIGVESLRTVVGRIKAANAPRYAPTPLSAPNLSPANTNPTPSESGVVRMSFSSHHSHDDQDLEYYDGESHGGEDMEDLSSSGGTVGSNRHHSHGSSH